MFPYFCTMLTIASSTTHMQDKEGKGKDIAVVDDHGLVVEGLRSLLRTLPDIGELFAVQSGQALLDVMKVRLFDVYIVDLELPDIDGVDLIRAIRERQSGARIIVNTMHEEIWTMARLTECDVDGVILKSSDPQLIKEAVRSVMEGRRFFCPRFHRLYARLVQRSGRPGREGDAPTARELEVLRAIARGLRTSEIAERLFISENTVETHRKNLMLKLGARNSADLVMRAVERGFLRVPCD